MNPGGLAGQNSDLWVGVLATLDAADYWFTVGEDGLWRTGIQPFRQAPLGILPPTEILDSPLPNGTYYFFFVVDKLMNGLPTLDWWNLVEVQVG